MDMKDLPKLILIIFSVGMLLGVGIFAIDKLGDSAQVDTTYNESFILSNVTAFSLTYNELQTGWYVANDSQQNVTWTANVTVDLERGTVILLDSSHNFSSRVAHINYTYDGDSATSLAMEGTRDAISPIGTVWMSLLVTISVLAIIMGIVLLSFGFRGRR